MPQDIMSSLKIDLGLCNFHNGKINPCIYHLNRCDSEIFKLCDNSGQKSGPDVRQITHKRTQDILKLSQMLKDENDPAGGWFLVQEQREWISKRLDLKFNQLKDKDKRIKILIAGVAGYPHFYSFIQILIESAKRIQIDLKNIYVDVVDKCIFPLLQIASIENNIRFDNLNDATYKAFDTKFRIRENNFKFLKSIKNDVKEMNIRIFLRDLRQLEDQEEMGFYDIISEHFLTSMFGKIPPIILKTRKSYSKMLNTGGSLLVATGVPHNDFIPMFEEIHSKVNLLPVNESITTVWDPYGMNRADFQAIIENPEGKIIAALDNCLIEFVKK